MAPSEAVPSAVPTLQLGELPMRDDPGAAYAAMRDAGPAVKLDIDWALARAEEVRLALRSPLVFSSAPAFTSLDSPIPLVPIAVDPPDHARFRKILDPFFSPKRLALLEPALREQAAEIIKVFADRGSCDLVGELAVPYPTQVFLTLLGLPLADRDRLLGWKDDILGAVDSSDTARYERRRKAAGELFDYLTHYIGERHRAEGDDVFSHLLAESGSGMTDLEIIGTAFLLVIAGLDTVTAALGLAFAHLAQRPDLRKRLVADPTTVPLAVEEFLRCEAPVWEVPRITTEDVTVDGVTIPAGSKVRVVIGAANRDPADYAEPDRLDFDRGRSRHLAFGGGVHRCLGSHLARLELRLALEEFHRRVPDYQLAPQADPRISWPAGIRKIDSLPLVFPAGQRPPD